MTPSTHGFTVPFQFPVCFTYDVFRAANRVLVDAVRHREPDTRHRVFAVIDSGVAAARPALLAEIEAYFRAAADALALAGPPAVIAGGEAVKNDFAHALHLLKQMNDVGLDRQSFVAAIGGGAVLDVASFAAALC